MHEHIPLQVAFLGMETSAALESRIAEHVAKLSRTGERVFGCRVSIEPPSGRRRGFNVHAKATTQHGDVVASNDADPSGTHEDPYLAVRDAMDALHRRLLDQRKKLLDHRAA